MSDDPRITEEESASPSSRPELAGVHYTPTKRRHVIKPKNVNTGIDKTERNSPFAKGIDFIGRLSKRSKGKVKKEILKNKTDSDGDASQNATSKLTDGAITSSEKDLEDCSTASPTKYQPPSDGDVQRKTMPTQSLQLCENKEERKNSKVKKSIKKNEKPKASKPKKASKTTVRSHVLTDYYPVRRSSRKTKSLLEKEQNDLIIKAIESKCEDGLSVVEFEGKGRGVVAKRAFKKGGFIVEYAGDLISWTEAKRREEHYSKDLSVGCYMYYFVYNNTNYCVDATSESGRLGRLLNHSRKNPNCKTKLVPVLDPKQGSTVPRLVIIAKRDISVEEELTYDYGDKDKETLQSHPWLKST